MLPTSPALQHVILYGGSFDPPHLAHVRLPQQTRLAWAAENGIDPAATLLLYVPAARSPHKAAAPRASDAQRLEMLKLALGPALTDPAAPVAIDTGELDRAAAAPGVPSYTIETVLLLGAELDGAGCSHTQLHLLIGADQLLVLHRWKRPRELVAMAPPLVMMREPNTEVEPLAEALLETGAWSPVDLAYLLAAVVPVPTMDASSTAARACAAAGDFAGLETIVGAAVGGYIRRHGLYQPAGGIGETR